MNIVIHNDLDPVFETLSLLYMSHTPNWKELTIEELQNFGFNGEAFYKKYYGTTERYISVFQKYRVSCPQEEFFFQNTDSITSQLILTLAVEHVPCQDTQTDDILKLRRLFAFYLADSLESSPHPSPDQMPQLPDEKAIIEFLENIDIKNEEKWFVLEFLRRPDHWLGQLADMIKQNLPAYEKARNSVDKPLAKLLFGCRIKEQPEFLKLAHTCMSDAQIYPCLASPVSQIILYSRGYYGLLVNALTKSSKSADLTKEALLRQLKALSDKSKLDILCALKASSKYNLELSDAMGLSPSTMSHHMNVLLSCGLVTVEKMDGKVYYCLQKEALSQLLSQLEHLLL